MSFYPEPVKEHFHAPRNVGDMTDADASHEAGSFTCGAIARLSLKIDAASQRIGDVRFKAVGCGYLMAAASVLTEIIKGLTTGEAAQLAQAPQQTITTRLCEFPSERAHCAVLVCETLLRAVQSYNDSVRDEWESEDALICTCFCVSERTVEREIRAGSLRTRKEVTRACLAGAGCGSCHPLIEDILDDYWRTESLDALT